jgi:hypothetical protein
MKPTFIDRLEQWKTRYETGSSADLERLLHLAATGPIQDAESFIRLHETLLFLYAYPRSKQVARLAEKALSGMAARVEALRTHGADLTAFGQPETSGIAGTSLQAVFSFEVAQQLSQQHGPAIGIDWDVWEDSDQVGSVLSRLIPLLREVWPVEAHVAFRPWLEAAAGTDGPLPWLLEKLSRDPRLYDSLQLQLTWSLGDSCAARTRTKLPVGPLFCHDRPLLRRRDVSLVRELDGPRLPVIKLPVPEARQVLDVILNTSAVRYRELYGFSHPDEKHVYRAEAGRGVQIYFFGVPQEWRLPLRAYHAGMFFKNGVPAGYVEVLSFFERAEVGFNLYYTFREGESAWIYAKVLHLCRQELGVTCFSVDPYQIGQENDEAIESGAFWFYRRLGFRPVDPVAVRLMEREELRIQERPSYRTPAHALRRMAAGPVLFETPGSEPGVWDRFSVGRLARALTKSGGGLRALAGRSNRWTREELEALDEIVRAKEGREERDYLLSMQQHRRLRSAAVLLGSR